jgi:CRISPR/Cas system type I-B associated protein Csh2 (Cas7 group RAMP superfamily)
MKLHRVVFDTPIRPATGGVTVAKLVRQRKSSRLGKFVSISRFRELESEVFQMKNAMESIRHESSNNLRRCGELQYEVDELKKTTACVR